MGKNIIRVFKNSDSAHKIIPRGLLSPTTLECIFGTISRQQWVGDDSLFAESPLIYTAEALNIVTAFQIKKSQLPCFPPECIECIINTSKGKLYWLKERILSINKINSQMLRKETNMLYQVSLNDLGKKFPIASENALHNLRNQKFTKVPPTRKSLLGINFGASKSVNKSVNFQENITDISVPTYIYQRHDAKFLKKLSLMRNNSSESQIDMVKLSCASVLKFGDFCAMHRKKQSRPHSSLRKYDKVRKESNIFINM